MKSYSLWGESDKYGNSIRNRHIRSPIPKGWSPSLESRIIRPEANIAVNPNHIETDEEKLEKMINELDRYELLIVERLRSSGENAATIIKCLKEIL